jgi:hypothetical protein
MVIGDAEDWDCGIGTAKIAKAATRSPADLIDIICLCPRTWIEREKMELTGPTARILMRYERTRTQGRALLRMLSKVALGPNSATLSTLIPTFREWNSQRALARAGSLSQ